MKKIHAKYKLFIKERQTFVILIDFGLGCSATVPLTIFLKNLSYTIEL
jgi:hypothetical protein